MHNLILQLRDYLKKVLGIDNVEILKTEIPSVPFMFSDLYTFYKIRILNKNLILFTLRQHDNVIPGTIKKHIEIIKQKVNKDIVFLCGQMTSYTRRDFINYKIQFIVPGNQMYLPNAGLDLREHFRQNMIITEKLSPAAQALVLYFIHNGIDISLTASELSDKLRYTCMTMGRAITEIVCMELGVDYKDGKKRYIRFEQVGKNLWNNSYKYMKSPVKKEVYINTIPNGIICFQAGLNALAEYTMIAEPQYKTIAVSKEDWLKIKDNTEILQNTGKYKLEVWTYPPGLFAENGIVDKLSLYLSLMTTDDERIEQSLEKMMENYKW